MLTGFELGVASTVFVLILAFAALKFSRRDREKLVIEKLEQNTVRLQNAISELMARANEVDQESKYLQGGLDLALSRRLEQACSDLVVLGDAVKVIEARIEQRELKLAKDDLLISLGAADKIRSQINEIREEIRRKRISG